MPVVDASVVAKVFIEEDGSAPARRIWAESAALFIPAHGLAEVAEVLARKARQGGMSRQQMNDAVAAALRSLLPVPIEPFIAEAADLALDAGASVYDCLYIAVAVSLGCPFITADRRLAAKMRETRFAALIEVLDSR